MYVVESLIELAVEVIDIATRKSEEKKRVANKSVSVEENCNKTENEE